MTEILLTLAALTTGLMAGLFAAFSYAVMPGLRKTDDSTFVTSMRAINRAILNPLFGLIFAGALVLLVVSLLATLSAADVWPWSAVAVALYLATLVITFAVNVPLNNQLDAGKEEPKSLRAAFERRWVTWNTARTLTNTGAFAAALVALLFV